MKLTGGFGGGVGAAIAMVLVMAVLRFISNTASVPELMEDGLLRLLDGKTKSNIINTFGVGGKALLLVTVVEGTILLGGLLGWLYVRYWPHARFEKQSKYVSGLAYGLLIGLLLNIVFLPLLGQGFFGASAIGVTAPPDIASALYGSNLAPWGLPAFLTMFVLGIVFGLALAALLPERVPATGSIAATGEPAMPERRDFMKVVGGGAVALFGGGILWTILRGALEAPPVAGVQEVDVAGETGPTPEPGKVAEGEVQATPAPASSFTDVKAKLVPEITPVENFYITTKNVIDPTLDGAAWKLRFTGMVENPYEIDLKELMAMPSTDRIETLGCISNPVGGNLMGNAKWTGVDFTEMLKKASPNAKATEVILRADDGYSDSIPLSVALNNKPFLAYMMNGANLTYKHGFPARLLVPNIYGMKNVKWITEVELSDQDHRGYWESQGWSDTAEYQISSRIDYPENRISAGPVYIGGVAFAGNRGIKRVEVSTDGGKSWGDALLRPLTSEYAWTQWTYPWIATQGEYKLMVRATDGTDTVQTSRKVDTYPDGATGWHVKGVQVG